MTREEAIEKLKHERDEDIFAPTFYRDKIHEALTMAIKALEQSEWIPVTERLPDSAGVYIVSRWFSDGCDSAILTDACYFDGTDTWHNDNRINHGREYVDKKIVAWMPLPEPWKGDEECP